MLHQIQRGAKRRGAQKEKPASGMAVDDPGVVLLRLLQRTTPTFPSVLLLSLLGQQPDGDNKKKDRPNGTSAPGGWFLLFHQ